LTDHERERAEILDAEERLFKGTAFRSNGKLTVSALAKEAGLKRWKLNDTHRVLADRFLARVRAEGSTPEAYRELEERNAELLRQHEQDRLALRQAQADLRRVAGVVQVLALENAELEGRLQGRAPMVTPIRRPESPV
jgi:hypothetical protein